MDQNNNQDPLLGNDNVIFPAESSTTVQNSTPVQVNTPTQAIAGKPVHKNTFLYVMLGVAGLLIAALIVVILTFGWPR